ncbi:Zinc finger CCCH domain-containing protein 32 [Linum grandiflorum]
MRTGTCKFGASCKYHHPKHQAMASVAPVTLNYLGYPLRPGEKECIYYIKTGQCKFGATCKFHHPQLANVQTPTQSLPPQPQVGPALYPAMQSPSVGSSQQYGVLVARPPLLQSSYPQVPYGPMLLSPGVVSYPSWSPYPGSVSPAASPSAQSATSIYGITQLSPSAPAYTGAYSPLPASTGPSSSSQMEQAFPERPGQPECQYYMKTGDCKFGSSCRYHHPRQLSVPKANVALSPLGLPLRPGAAVCTHYTQRGQCKFGAVCRFDHPIPTAISYSPSASSLADMPVAPYPVGSSLGTLAPSSSSSELNSGSSRDSSSSTRNRNMASSVSTQSGFIGSTFSDDTPAQHSGHLSSSSKSASS